jgi:PAS domain S-box-containing protein
VTGVFDMATTAMTLLDALNDAVLVLDVEGRIVYVNRAIERVLEWPPDDLLGQPVTILIPEALRQAHLTGFQRYMRTGRRRLFGQPLRIPALTGSGGERLVELVLSSLELPDGSRLVAAAMRDVAERLDLERQSALANQLLQVFTRDLTGPELIEETIAALGRALDMPAAAFWAPVAQRRTLRCEAFWRESGLGSALEEVSRELHLEPGQGLPGRVWASGQPAWISAEDPDESFLRRDQVVVDGLRSGLAFPVRFRQDLLGVIELYSFAATEPDEGLLDLMRIMGRRLGEVLYSARLEEERRQLADRERAVAAAFRESLLPDSVPAIPGLEIGTAFSPGGEGVVGGDFYDVYPLSAIDGTSRWGVTIGDVCGTGPEAAAVTSKVRYTARALMRAGHGLVEVGEHINTAMAGRKGRRFCTGIIGMLLVRGDEVELRFVNAGHPPPVLRRADGAVRVLPTGGSLLGALPRVTLTEHRLQLDPGDVVVLYTDGVTEARRRAGELFGEERLVHLVGELGPQGATAVASGLRERVQQFVDEGLGDDVAILVLGRRSPLPTESSRQ